MATIQQLPEHTIQLIAAGEVITKPHSVVKELLENSLDAGAYNVRISFEQGGMGFIEIIDNGHGIAKNNAELLCKRYATSKLRTANDLCGIATFGFRGEALSSISEVADVEVKSFNMKSDKMGWHAKYRGSELVEGPVDKYLQNCGTQIRITNLFGTSMVRKKAMQSSIIEEKKHIIELVQRYAIHNRHLVTMTLREGSSNDLVCLLAPMGTKPCFGMFFGMEVENNLIEISAQSETPFNVQVNGVISYKKSNSNSNSFSFILFVNERLVICNELKREVEAQVFEHLGLKQHAAIAYIDIIVPPEDVDVNTHPSKTTVALHYQTDITSLIVNRLRERFKERLSAHVLESRTASCRTVTQMVISSQKSPSSQVSQPGNVERLRLLAPGSLDNASQAATTGGSTKRPCQLVHNDPTQTTLQQLYREDTHLRRNLRLKSIHDLRLEVAEEKARDSVAIIKNSVFVGVYDHDRALIQHETKMYAINLKEFLREQYYQFYLFDFANFPPIRIQPPGNKIRHLIETYLQDIKQHEIQTFDSLKYRETEQIIDELLERSGMFEDYLTLRITRDEVLALPCIIPDVIPNLVYLGKFFVDLVNKVDYTEEKSCLKSIGRVIADFYSEPPANLRNSNVHIKYHDLLQSKLYVAIKSYLLIPERLFQKENICQVSDTRDLYKVFERC